MSEALQAQVKASPATHLLTPVHPGVLQRKCACGSSASNSGQCRQCNDKEKPLQRYSNSRTADSLLGSLADSSLTAPPQGSQHNSASTLSHSFGRVTVHTRTLQRLQPKLSISSPTDEHEQEADRAAELITGASQHSAPAPSHLAPPLSSTQPLIQRASADRNIAAQVTPAPVAATSEPTSRTEEAEETSPAGLIVEDDAAQLAPAQMRKTQFLDQLQSEVCAAADAELLSVGRSAQGCPYIENWIGYYRSRPSQYVERALRKYAPDAAAATSAQDYIPLVAQRVRRAVAVWATTGEITGVPDELAGQLPSGGLLGADQGVLSGIGGAISDAAGSVGTPSGSIFTKAKEGGPRQADDPQQIQAQLNDGQTLDGGVKSRMEAAYGHDFSRVRVHTGSRAADLSNDLNARAFTIGSDIAFAAGEYKPGTLVGDALLAHELAHVVQQGGAVSSDGPMHKGGTAYDALEDDADVSAVGAVASLWGGAKGKLKDIAQNAMPRMRSGLRLSRCDDDKKPEPAPKEKPKSGPSVPASPPGEGWVRNDTPGGVKLGKADIEGTYYIDASTSAKAQKTPAKGDPAIYKPNYAGAFFAFSDKKKGADCAGGSGERVWLSYKYYKELTIAGAASPGVTTDKWVPDISGPFVTNGVDFEDFAGIGVPGAEGVAGIIRRTYRVGIVCHCKSDSTYKVMTKGFLTEYSYNLDIWFNNNDVAVRVSPGDSYGGPLDWCSIPPSGYTCVESCPVEKPKAEPPKQKTPPEPPKKP